MIRKKNSFFRGKTIAGVTIVFLLALSWRVYAGAGKPGAAILNKPIGAKASGMGEAYTAIGGDLYGLYYNPAGIAGIKERQASLFGQKGFMEGEYFGALAYGMPTKVGSFALSLAYYTAGKIELIDSSWNETEVNAQKDYLISLGYGRDLAENIDVGLSIKNLGSKLVEKFSASSYIFDLGAIYRVSRTPVSIGAAVQNIGSKLKYIDEGDYLPLTLRIGGSYYMEDKFNIPMLIAADIVKVRDDSRLKEHLGIEYMLKEKLSMRAGYKIGYDLDSFTFGIGFLFDFFDIDYSFNIMGELDAVHKVSLNINFGSRAERFYANGMEYLKRANYERAGYMFYRCMLSEPDKEEYQNELRELVENDADNTAYFGVAVELARQYVRERKYDDAIKLYHYAIDMAQEIERQKNK